MNQKHTKKNLFNIKIVCGNNGIFYCKVGENFENID